MRTIHAGFKKYRLLLSLIVVVATFDLVLAFSPHWRTQFDNSNDLSQWQQFKVGACSGQNHSVSGGIAHLSAGYGADCFGAFYRDTYNGSPGTFPTAQDVRVMWRWRYPAYGWYGSEAGQVTSAFGQAQYYGVSAVDSPVADFAHVESSGDWGSWDVDRPMWRSSARDTGWHVSTFDFICDGRQMDWWLDGAQFHHVGNGTVRPPNDPWRPAQFWFGNLITNVGADNSWTNHDLDYVYIYAVERPQMNTPTPGGGGRQSVTWQAVSNTPQPDGSSWGIDYQAMACADAACGNVVETSPWVSDTGYTFSGLPLQATYYYRARARWVGTPELITCWGNTVVAEMRGEPNLVLAKSATVEQEPGEPVQYSLIVQNTGDAPASGVVIRDPIPGYIVEPGSVSSGGGVQGSEVVWNLGRLDQGESRTLSWQGRVDGAIPSSVAHLVNAATVSDDGGRTARAEATTQIIRPQLRLTKTATPQVWPGGEIAYEITVQSIGSAPLRNIMIRDPLPDFVVNPTTLSHGGQVQGRDLVWTLDTLAPGQSVVLTWQARVDPATPSDQTSITNQVLGSAGGGVTGQAEATSLVIFPQVALGKAGPAEAAPGEVIQYTLVVQNTGPAPAYDVTVVDPIPAYVLDPGQISGGGQVIGNEIVWEIGALASGESRTLLWAGTVDLATPATKAVIDNIATACDGSGRCTPAVFRTRLLKPAARLIKNAEPYGWPGRDLTYQIIVENTGETVLTEVVVRDPLPEFVLYPREISHGGQAVEYPFEGKIETTWYLGDLAPGQRVELSWLGTVDPGLPAEEYAIRNQAFLETAQGLSRVAEGSTYILHPAVRVSKSAPREAGPGQQVDYTIVVENPSWAPAYEVEITDPIPPYLLDPAGVTGGGEIRAEAIRWDLAELAPGEVRVLNWSGYIDPALPAGETRLVNTVTVREMTGQSDTAEAVTNLPGQQLYMYKSAPYRVYPGATLGYTVTVQNRSDITLYELDIRDEVPEAILNPGAISHGGRFEGNVEIVWEIGALAPGQTLALTWQGTVDPAWPREQGTIWNEVRLTSAGGLAAQARAKSFVEPPSLVLAKTATPQAGPGEVVSYTLSVENTGRVPVLAVEVQDPLPAYIVNPGGINEGGTVETVPAPAVVWSLGTLAPGERRTLSWQGTIELTVPLAQDQIVNIATVQAAGGVEVSAAATTQVLKPALEFNKIAPTAIGPGEPVRYRLVLTNTGEMTLRAVQVTDLIPAYVLDPVDLSPSGVLSDNQLIWEADVLAPSEALIFTWEGTLDPGLPLGLVELTNRAQVTAWPGLELETSATSAVRQPDLQVLKQATSPVNPGELIDYTIDLINQGDTTIYGLQVEDPLPPGLTPATINQGGYEVPGRIIWDNLDNLPPGEGRTLTWQARVDLNLSPEIEVITNVVRVRALGGLQVEAQAASHLDRPGLVMVKTASTSAYAGGPIRYTLRLTNHGPGLERQLEVRDSLPAYVSYVPDSATGYGQLVDEALTWQLDGLQPGQTVELSWRGQVALDLPATVETIVNEAQAWSLDTPAPMTATATTRLLEPGVTMQLLCPPLAQAGDTVSYTVRIHNAGAGTLSQPRVRLPLPVGTGYRAGSATAGGRLLTGLTDAWGEPRPDEVVWEPDTLAPGERLQLAFALSVSAEATDQIDSVIDLLSGEEAISQGRCQTALLVPRLVVTKRGPARATINEQATYDLTVENSGPVVAHNAILTDVLPFGLTYLPGTASPGGAVTPFNPGSGEVISSPTRLSWTLGDLSPGQRVTRRFQGQIHFPLTDVAASLVPYNEQGEVVLVNSAEATALRAARTWTSTVTLVPRPVLTLTRVAWVEAETGLLTRYTPAEAASEGPLSGLERSLAGAIPVIVPAAQVRPGELISHTLTGANAGPGLARQAVLRDRVPPDLIVLEDTISQGGYYDELDHAIVWPLGDLPEAGIVQRSYTLLAPVALRPDLQPVADNRGLLTSPDAPTAYANARTEISGTFTLAGLKTATAFVNPGEPIDYAIRVQNTSPNLVGNVVIQDPLPAPVRYVADSASLPPVLSDEGQTLSWNLGVLAPGETREVRFRAVVEPTLPDWLDRVINEAGISFSGGSLTVRAVTMLPSIQPPTTPPTAEPPSTRPDEPAAPPPAESTATPWPGRPPVVDLGGPVTPTVTAGLTVTVAPTPLPAPALRKSVSAETVRSGQTTPLTWRLTFSNPTPLTIHGLVIRDLLPAGLLFVEGQASHGTLHLTSRDAAAEAHVGGIDPLSLATPATSLAPASPSGLIPTGVMTVARTSTPILPADPVQSRPVTATTAISSTAPHSQDLPLTEVVIELAEVPPAGRVEIILHTRVLSDALPGTVYHNVATYAATNLAPGRSNEVEVLVPRSGLLLPVTGGLLDPWTPQGQVTWSSTFGVILIGVLIWRRWRARRQRRAR